MKTVYLSALLATVVLSAATHAADIDQGRALAQTTCVACHDQDGNTPAAPGYPKLAGQYPDYLAKAMRDYQTGARKNPIMGAIAQPLSKADI
ncbi:MAG TPA: cytochrome c, partial [Burkholderiaceae bacterium]|nr:cytochrome c [Burkholderiaceae bacterium]